jgi:hypothetical protein
MRCYLDCTYHNWRQPDLRTRPNTIVRRPTVTLRDDITPPYVTVAWMAPLGLVELSDYLIERDPAFSATEYAAVAASLLTYSDVDTAGLDLSQASAGNVTVRYRVKKADALYWSPWSDCVTVVSRSPSLAPTGDATSLVPGAVVMIIMMMTVLLLGSMGIRS